MVLFPDKELKFESEISVATGGVYNERTGNKTNRQVGR